MSKEKSDGSSADYYKLPPGVSQLQHLISYRNMNAQIGEIFRACYRYGLVSHSDMLRDAKKMRYYAQAEIERLEALMEVKPKDEIRQGGGMFNCLTHGLHLGLSCPKCEHEVIKVGEDPISKKRFDEVYKQSPFFKVGFCSHGYSNWFECPECSKPTAQTNKDTN